MGKTIAAAFGVMLLGGCAMKEFSSSPLYTGNEVKFYGAVEDRVNLWPVAYWREPVGSVAWPLVSWGDDHLALRPVYSQYRQRAGGDYDEFNVLWPIAQFDTRHRDYRVFPFFWGKDYGGDPYFCLFPALFWNDEFAGVFPVFWDNDGNEGHGGFCVFPLVWAEWTAWGSACHTVWPLYYYESFPKSDNHSPSDQSEFWALGYLAGWNRKDGEWQDHRFLPFYVWDRGDFCSLPYSCCEENGINKTQILAGLAGCNAATNGDSLASWIFPLYYKDESAFASLPYCRQLGKDGEIDIAFSLPLLSGYERDLKSGDRLLYLLMGLGGKAWNDETGGASWAFPLYYRDRESFYTLLYGHNPHRTWLFPLYFDGDERTYITPLYGRDKKDGSDWLFPLYYRDQASFVTPLYGKSGDADWLFPIFLREADGSFYSIPFGWSGGQACTNMYFAAGIAGVKSGETEGGWLFPVYSRETDAAYGVKAGWMDAAKLPDDIGIWMATWTNRIWNSSEKAHDSIVVQGLRATEVSARDVRTVFLVSDNDRHLGGGLSCVDTNRYELTERHKLGNQLVFNHERERKVGFDAATRDKISDSEESDTSLLVLLYNGEHRSDKAKGTSSTSHRVLWKLWDWEEENGDVALDVFPGFTYDSKTDGYSKTSLLWRFFRYENDPGKGKEIDILFIPVWR